MTVTDEQVIRDHLDLEMLERPHLWPRKFPPTVFLKRHVPRSSKTQNARCVLLSEGEYVVKVDFEGDEATDQTLHYTSVHTLLAAGWKVD